MSVVTSISIKNEDWAYLREKKLSPTALFNLGISRHRKLEITPELDDGSHLDEPEKKSALEEKNKKLLDVIEILDARAQRAEAQLRAEQEYRRSHGG